MQLTNLYLKNFRNYIGTDFIFSNTNIISGRNATGKTNILEAIYFLCTTSSFKKGKDTDSIRFGSEYASIKGITNENTQLEVILNNGRKITKINNIGRQKKKFRENLACVLFKPDDLNLLDGSPSLRRGFLDSSIAEAYTNYAEITKHYNLVVRNRNRVLERVREGVETTESLNYWDSVLISLALQIESKRSEYVSFLKENLHLHMNTFSSFHSNSEKSKIEINYVTKLLSSESVKTIRNAEIASGKTLRGPHKADFTVLVNGKDLSLFGSRGQQRVAVLALKKSELQFVEIIKKTAPILLLDDIFSELDETAQGGVADIVKNYQSFITTVGKQDKSMFRGLQAEFFELPLRTS